MLLKDIPVFQALHKRMDWLSARQTVLAENVANADTPGYRARDLKQLSFRELMAGNRPSMNAARTHSGHIEGRTRASSYADDSNDAAIESTPSDNAVVLEEQTLKVSDTRQDYDLATSLYRKHMSMIRTALGRPR